MYHAALQTRRVWEDVLAQYHEERVRKSPTSVSDIERRERLETRSLSTWVHKLLCVIHELFHSIGLSFFMCSIKMYMNLYFWKDP